MQRNGAIRARQAYNATPSADYLEDQRSELPEQYRIIGFADGHLTTFIIEYRADKGGKYIWVVTAWKSTKQERKNYEQRIY